MEESNCERDHQAHTQADSTPDYRRVPDIRFRGFTYAWERRKLDETVSFYSGLTYSPSDICDAGGTLVLRSSNVQSGELAFVDNVYVNDSVASSEQVRKNDLIVVVRNGSRALLGKHAIIRDDMPKTVIGAFMTGIRSDEQEFMNALMSSRAFESEINKNLGATINQITGGMFAEMTFSMPDESEQHAIGSLFFKLDSLVTLHQRKLTKLHTIKKALLEKMFPTPGSTIPEIRFRGFTETWERRKFGELYRPVSEKNDLSFGRDKAISVANMYFNPALYVTEDSYLATYNVMRLGDIAFEGNRNKRFAHGRFVENTIGDGIVSHVFKVFRHVGDNYDLSYWKHAINNEKLMKDVLTRSTKASTMMHELVTADFLEESTLVPSLNEQRAIGAAIDSIDHLATLYQHKLNKLHCIKKALLEKMFV